MKSIQVDSSESSKMWKALHLPDSELNCNWIVLFYDDNAIWGLDGHVQIVLSMVRIHGSCHNHSTLVQKRISSLVKNVF